MQIDHHLIELIEIERAAWKQMWMGGTAESIEQSTHTPVSHPMVEAQAQEIKPHKSVGTTCRVQTRGLGACLCSFFFLALVAPEESTAGLARRDSTRLLPPVWGRTFFSLPCTIPFDSPTIHLY